MVAGRIFSWRLRTSVASRLGEKESTFVAWVRASAPSAPPADAHGYNYKTQANLEMRGSV